MPKKPSHPKHTPYQYPSSISRKKRYPTKQAAEAAARHIPTDPASDLQISAYKDIDGGWYLTSNLNG